MINFLNWSMPLLGPSMIAVPALAIILLIIAIEMDDDKFGSYAVSFVITMLLIWGIWIGAYHVYPVVESNCPYNEQYKEYCK